MDTEGSYREIFERSPDAILVMEGDRFVDCNPSAVRMLRFPSREALLKHFSGSEGSDGRTAHPADISPPLQPDGRGSRAKAEEMLQTTFERGSHTFEWLHTCADGEPLLVEVQLTVVRQGDKPLLHVVWRDISERKRLEAELQRSQRLEAVGRLAGGVAHDFNNLLMVILGHAEQLQREPDATPDATEHGVRIREAADRAAALTQQLLAFSRGQPTQPRVTDLGELLEGLSPLLSRLIGEHVELELSRDGGALTVLADPTQLEQLVVNLAVNGQDAMPDGGRLQMAVGRGRVDTPQRCRALSAGDYVTLTVTDSGTGMSPEELDRAFEPFYTTKAVGKGTGLGLATVHAVAEQNGGHSWIESEVGQGTTVHVWLPLSRLTSRPAPQPTPRRVSGGQETILLVEDEDAIRRLFERSLSEVGYEVLTASDGQEALELMESKGDAIDLLVTDVVMPRLSGLELVRHLTSHRPDLPVIFMSGYAPDQQLGELGDERLMVLRKPFSPDLLHERIRLHLDRPIGEG